MSNSNKLFVAVTAGRWQLPAINAAHRLGLQVCALDGDPTADGFAIADISTNIEINDETAVLDFIERQNNQIVGSLSFASEVGMETMGLINDFYELNGLSKIEASLFTDKWAQRKNWESNGLPNPNFLTIKKDRQVDENFILELNDLGSKIIVKPRQSSGSRGLTVLNIPYSIESVQRAIETAVLQSRSDGAIIESFIDGKEYAAEGFTYKGKFYPLCLSEKRKVDSTNNTVANELFTPTIDKKISDEIWQVVQNAVLSLSDSDTSSHTEVLVDSLGKIWLVESAGRGGGFMVAEGLLPWAFGIDLAEISVKAACNIEMTIPEPNKTYATLRFYPSRKGILKSILGMDKCHGVRNLLVGALADIGTQFSEGQNDAARLGYILARGNSQREALALADFAMESIEFNVEPE
jgi:biotin carboxylase